MFVLIRNDADTRSFKVICLSVSGSEQGEFSRNKASKTMVCTDTVNKTQVI